MHAHTAGEVLTALRLDVVHLHRSERFGPSDLDQVAVLAADLRVNMEKAVTGPQFTGSDEPPGVDTHGLPHKVVSGDVERVASFRVDA